MTSFTPSRRRVRYVVGIDIGGTNIVAGTVAEDGSEVLGLVSEPTLAEQGAEGVLSRIMKLARASMAAARGKEIAGLGIGSPGPLDTTTGVVLLTPNLGWVNFPLRDRVAGALGMPATLDNDANCAIFGEWWRVAARGATRASGAAPDAGRFLGPGGATLATISTRGCGYTAGGGPPAGKSLSLPLRSEVRRRAFKPAVEACRIVPGELTGTAGVYGAAAVFIKHTWGRV